MTPKKTSPHKQDQSVSSLGAAATALSTTVPALQALRDSGCPGFNLNGRVNISKVRRHLTEKGSAKLETPAPGASLKDQKTSEEIRKLRIANDAREKMSVLRSDVNGSLSAMEKAVDSLLENMLEKEYPSSVAGLDVAGARVYGRNLRDRIRAEVRKIGESWTI